MAGQEGQMEITDRQLFDRYVEYKKSTVDKEKIDQKLIGAFLRRKPHASKADRRKYKGSKEFREKRQEQIEWAQARFSEEKILGDRLLMEEYRKLEEAAAGSRQLLPVKDLLIRVQTGEFHEDLERSADAFAEEIRNEVRKRAQRAMGRYPFRLQWNQPLNEDTIELFVRDVRYDPLSFTDRMTGVCDINAGWPDPAGRTILSLGFLKKCPTMGRMYRNYPLIRGKINDELRRDRRLTAAALETLSEYTADAVIDGVLSQPRYEELKASYEEKTRIHTNIISAIPKDIIDLYPATRMMKRRFVLHLGPTNSGKTYEAMQELRRAGDGLYLAPLRLLAYEQYETMNRDGYKCSMITGEEIRREEGSFFTASTIEMCDFENHYSCAVIDEAQMISDGYRGGAWTNALLGVMADEVHVCASDNAEAVLKKIIAMCRDTCEVVRHERKTTLTFLKDGIAFPDEIQPHDACIAFSRKMVHGLAAELQSRQLSCSVIYGALPYDVRHEEARRFAEGETDVLVATDAIGMGMNLPIRRVVFCEDTKFDGEERRDLNESEVKQIAGRAGRFGIYDPGYAVCIEPYELRHTFFEDPVPIEKAFLSFPRSLIGIEGRLSATIGEWQSMRIGDGILLESTDVMQMLAAKAEQLTDDKLLIYELCTIPFDEDDEDLMLTWEALAADVVDGRELRIPVLLDGAEDGTDLESLEASSRLCDLLYNFDRKFNDGKYNDAIAKIRTTVSKKIMDILSRQKLLGRTCPECGRKMRWDHPYRICERCFNARRRRRASRRERRE